MHPRFRNLVLAFLLTSLSTSGIGQDRAPFNAVDLFIKNLSLRSSTQDDIRLIAVEIKKQFTTANERARAAYSWIANNIAYDWDGFRKGAGIWKLDDVLKSRKSVCEGYARLMKFFCEELEIPCTLIYGFAAGVGVWFPEPDEIGSNHAWNAVMIEGQWKLIDVTWGDDLSDDSYFYADPSELIRSHFPDSAKWQLLQVPYTREQFSDLVIRIQADEEKRLITLGVTMNIAVKGTVGEYVRFKIKSRDTLNRVSIGVFDKKGRVEYSYDTISYAGNGNYYYDFLVPREGEYQVNVSGLYMGIGETEAVGTAMDSYYLYAGQQPKKEGSQKKGKGKH